MEALGAGCKHTYNAGQTVPVRDGGRVIFFVGQSRGMWDGWQVWSSEVIVLLPCSSVLFT